MYMKSEKCFDLMARGNSHCCHHMGIVKYYPTYILNLHKSSMLIDANANYKGAKLNLKNVIYSNTLKLYLDCIKALLYKNSVLFAGLHLRQALYLLPLIAFNGGVTIHLHGQSHSLEKKLIKYILWKLISFFAILEVGNPAWMGPKFVKVINNINVLHNPITITDSKKVLLYSSLRRKYSDLNTIRNKLINKNLDLIVGNPGISYEELNQLFNSIGFIYIDYCGSYYSYSPSGHISDAINYGLTLVLNKDDSQNITVVKKYKASYILI